MSAERPLIFALDCETVPDQHLLDVELESGVDVEAARKAAAAGDRDGVIVALGGPEQCKPGNRSKPDSLVEFVDGYLEDRHEQLVKSMSLDYTRAAVCSVSIVCSPRQPGEPLKGYIVSWGIGNDRSSWASTAQVGTPGAGDPAQAPPPELVHELSTCVATGLEVSLARIPCVAEPKPLAEMTAEEQYQAERRLLHTVWGLVRAWKPGFDAKLATFATFNGQGYDLPLLAWRSMVHRAPTRLSSVIEHVNNLDHVGGVVPATLFQQPAKATRPHLDCAQVAWGFSSRNSTGRGLGRIAKALRLPGAKLEGMSGSEVYPTALRGDWARVEAYNLGDAVLTLKMAEAMIDGGLA